MHLNGKPLQLTNLELLIRHGERDRRVAAETGSLRFGRTTPRTSVRRAKLGKSACKRFFDSATVALFRGIGAPYHADASIDYGAKRVNNGEYRNPGWSDLP